MVAKVDRAVGQVNRITSSGVTFESRCSTCSGSGIVSQAIDISDLVDIYKVHPEGMKINRIKEVRAKWGMALKPAKELVEAYDRLLTELTGINYS